MNNREEETMNKRIDDFQKNEIGMGKYFAYLHGNDIKYNKNTQIFLVWNQEKGVWETETNDFVKKIVTDFLYEELPQIISGMKDKNKIKEYNDFLKRLQNNSKIESILKIAKRESEMMIMKYGKILL